MYWSMGHINCFFPSHFFASQCFMRCFISRPFNLELSFQHISSPFKSWHCCCCCCCCCCCWLLQMPTAFQQTPRWCPPSPWSGCARCAPGPSALGPSWWFWGRSWPGIDINRWFVLVDFLGISKDLFDDILVDFVDFQRLVWCHNFWI